MAIKIGHASVGENGKAIGGAAGDQTGREVCVRTWYNGKWDCVLRPKNPQVAEKSAIFVEKACANDNIGYDQSGRNTLFAQAAAVNFDASKIKVKCECDCSSLIHVAVLAAGADITYGSNGFTTRTMSDRLVASGDYEKITDSKYLTSDKHLKRGDILVKVDSHTVMVLENGSEVQERTPKATYRVKTQKSGWLPPVVNLEDYAGISNQPIIGLALMIDGTDVKYRVHTTKKGWLPYVTGYDINDYKNGWAGDNTPIDAIEIVCASKTVKYRVDTVKRNQYFSWQHNNNTDAGQDGYAGLFGEAIDRVQITVE